jgi:DNA-binding transcriptional ArsR family regulator
MHLNELAKALRIVGDESRLRTICILFKKKKLCVSEIAGELGASVAVTSHHLQVLAEEGLLVSVREGKNTCYSLAANPLIKDLKALICKYT